jgi:Spy/CpxP family protein refolding chaperone
MKKKAAVLVLGILAITCATCFIALAAPPGPPPLGGAFFGGPPGPPPGPPPPGAGFFGGSLGPPPGSPPFGPLFGPPDLVEKLKLTDDQLKQMRQVFVDFENNSREARIILMGLHDEKRTMLMSGKIDQAKLEKMDEYTAKLASEVMTKELKMKRDLLSKLTPDQIDRMAIFSDKGDAGHEKKVGGK